MYKRDIYLDIDDKMNNYIKSVELDSNSRIWHFHLTVDYQPLNLTGKTVKFMAEKPDKTNVLNDCKIIDAENGIVKVELTRQVNAVPGHVNCLLKIVGSDGYVLKTKTFIVEVSKTLSDKPIVSTNEFSALDEALGRVQNIDQRFAETNAQLSEKASVLNTLDFINVVSLGVDNSGRIDVTDMLQNIIDNAKVHATIYFPTGEYLISKGLVVKKPITIKGNSRHINDIPPYGASIIRVKDGVSNITALSTKNNGLRWSVDGITFYSTSFTLEHIKGTEIGLKYAPNVVNQNVNGLNMGTDSHYSSCNNVFAWGFSGTGIHLGGDSLNKNICACHCGLGIVLETDASLDNFRSQFCDYGFEAKIGTTVTNGRVEEISKFGITFNESIRCLMRNVIVDQCGYSGIRLKGIVTEVNVEVDIIRCCSYYYGLTTNQILSNENIKHEAIAKIYIDENASVSNNIIKDAGNLAMGLDDDVQGLFTPFFLNARSDIYGGCEFYCNGLNIGRKFSITSSNTELCEEYKKSLYRTSKDMFSNTIISDYKNSITIDNNMIRKIDNIIFGGTWIAPEFVGQFNISNNTLYMAKGLTADDWVLINNLGTIG